MADVSLSAELIAEAVARPQAPSAVRWRWGTVAARSGTTADVTIAGSTVEGLRVVAGVYAPVGARVRVSYLGTDAVVDASLSERPADEYPLASLSGTGTNYFYAHNGCATLMSSGTTPSAQWGTQSVCTIPSGYRPKTTLYFPMAKTGAAISDSYMQVDSDGTVTIQNWGGTQAAREYRATCTWAY